MYALLDLNAKPILQTVAAPGFGGWGASVVATCKVGGKFYVAQ